MLSRVADAIYWLSRYIERAENVARFIDVNHYLTMDMPESSPGEWRSLVTVTGDERWFMERFGVATAENVIYFLTFDPENPNSILSCVRSARENARSIRDAISSEMWEQVNRFFLMVTNPGAASEAARNPHRFYEDVKMASHLFTGLCEGTLSHSEGWHFTRLGRFIERADKTSRILDVKYFILLPEPGYVGTPYDSLQWAAVLKSASALEMYRKSRHRIDPASVVDFLILDAEFPRAIHYCLINAERAAHGINGSPLGMCRDEVERRLGRLRSDLDFSDVGEIMDYGLHEYLDGLQAKLNLVGDAVFNQYFALRPMQESFVQRAG